MSKPKFVDVGGPHGLPEDERIKMIGNKAMLGQVVGVLVEESSEDVGKVDRYIEKVTTRYPGIELEYRAIYMKSQGGDIYLLRFKKKAS